VLIQLSLVAFVLKSEQKPNFGLCGGDVRLEYATDFTGVPSAAERSEFSATGVSHFQQNFQKALMFDGPPQQYQSRCCRQGWDRAPRSGKID